MFVGFHNHFTAEFAENAENSTYFLCLSCVVCRASSAISTVRKCKPTFLSTPPRSGLLPVGADLCVRPCMSAPPRRQGVVEIALMPYIFLEINREATESAKTS
jgi:hypothetical protein